MVESKAVQGGKSFEIGYSQKHGWREAVDECLSQVTVSLNTGNLGFIYTTDSFSDQMDLIVQRFRNQTNVKNWVGSTGVGILRSGREEYENSAMNIMIGTFPENSFKVFSGVSGQLQKFTENFNSWLENNLQTFSVIHVDPQTQNLPRLIPEFADILQEGYLIGALSSAHGHTIQIANGTQSAGISGVMFSEDVPVSTGVTQGCSPIGPQRTITNVSENIIFAIDDRPALEVFKEDIGEELASDLGRLVGNVFAALPLVGSDTGDYLVRNIVGVDPQHNLIAIGDNVEVGNPIFFCQRDKNTAEKDLTRMLQVMRRRIKGAIPRGALYFSCLGRGRHTFGDESSEMMIIQREFGDLPLVGFFANGEISHRSLYTYTGVLAVFL